MKSLVLAVLATLALASAALAIDAPLLSEKRLSIGAGANYEFTNNPFEGSEPVKDRKQEFTAGLYAAYNLTPDLSLVGSSTLGLTSRQVRTSLGLRVRLYRGGE